MSAAFSDQHEQKRGRQEMRGIKMSPTANTVYPSFGIDKRIPTFLDRFYRVSDDENSAEEYLTLFTPDASFQFLSLRLHGTEGLFTNMSLKLMNRDQDAAENDVGGECSETT